MKVSSTPNIHFYGITQYQRFKISIPVHEVVKPIALDIKTNRYKSNKFTLDIIYLEHQHVHASVPLMNYF